MTPIPAAAAAPATIASCAAVATASAQAPLTPVAAQGDSSSSTAAPPRQEPAQTPGLPPGLPAQQHVPEEPEAKFTTSKAAAWVPPTPPPASPKGTGSAG